MIQPRFLVLLVLTLASVCARAGAADPDPNRVIQLDIGRNWVVSNWGGGPFPKTVDLDMDSSGATFLVSDPGTRQTFLYKFDLPIDTRRYPLITMKYRARSTEPGSSLYNLWLDDSTGPNGAGMRPFMGNEIIPDEQPHELKADLRKFKTKGPCPQMVLAVAANKAGNARFDLLEMRFEAPPDANLQELGDAPAITVEVHDPAGKPVKGAKAISSYERINFRRAATTNDKGVATLTPIATETEHQMLHVEADGMFPVDLVDPTTPAQVKLQKSMQVSATVTDETGEAIEGASVKLYVPIDSADQTTRQRNQFTFKTDSKGRWSSPAVPDPGANRKPYLQVSHPDFISDESFVESRVPLAQLRDGSAIIVLKKRR